VRPEIEKEDDPLEEDLCEESEIYRNMMVPCYSPCHTVNDTVDGRNPAPPWIVETL